VIAHTGVAAPETLPPVFFIAPMKYSQILLPRVLNDFNAEAAAVGPSTLHAIFTLRVGNVLHQCSEDIDCGSTIWY
jgi:hypothetical protein